VGGWRAGLGYTGEWQDAAVGLVYLRARWYAPGVGIFTAPDPFPGVWTEPGSRHPYLYTLANPVNTRDPRGKYPVPLVRPGDVCPSPTEFSIPRRSLMFRRSEYILRRADGSLAFRPGPGVSEWWYCGEFKITAYQFVSEANDIGVKWYTVGGEVEITTTDGRTFSANALFVQDVMENGTGRPAMGNCPDGYFHAPGDGNFYCGKGKSFDPATDAYQVVAADLSVLTIGARIYVPGLQDTAEPHLGNADFVVRDSGGGLRRDQIDVFVGEGPGIRSGQYNDCPSLLYTAYHARRGITLGSLALYQRSRYHYSLFPCFLVEDQP